MIPASNPAFNRLSDILSGPLMKLGSVLFSGARAVGRPFATYTGERKWSNLFTGLGQGQPALARWALGLPLMAAAGAGGFAWGAFKAGSRQPLGEGPIGKIPGYAAYWPFTGEPPTEKTARAIAHPRYWDVDLSEMMEREKERAGELLYKGRMKSNMDPGNMIGSVLSQQVVAYGTPVSPNNLGATGDIVLALNDARR